MGKIQSLIINSIKRLLILLFFSSSFLSNAQGSDTNDNISFYKKYSGANLTYKQIGNSEIKYNTNPNDFSSCSKNNGAATSAYLDLPSDAVIQAVYIQWFALVKHNRPGITTYAPLSRTIPITFPDGTTKTITSDKAYRETVPFSGLYPVYEGHLADITSDVLKQDSPGGNYTADIILNNDYANLRGACSYSQENARAWQMLVVYKSPTEEPGINQVYMYDGLKSFVNEEITIPVNKYKVYSGDTAGSISVASLQGSPNLSGEFITVSDVAFGSFPTDFANSSGISNPAPGNNASNSDPYGGWDIDVVNSNFTPNTTELDLKAGSTGDLILMDLIVLKIPTGGLVVDKKTTTSTVNLGENGTYEITLNNVSDVDLKGVTTQDILPSGFTYAQTTSIVLNNATQTSNAAPTAGDSTLNWGTFNINGKGSVTITFDVTIPLNEPIGTYHNGATAKVVTPSDAVITNYDSSDSNNDDITVINPCDPISSGNIDTDNDGISDVCDLDDDNDGILDTDELCSNSTTIKQNSLITIEINFDGYASETSWNLVNPSGNIVLSVEFGTYTNSQNTVTETFSATVAGEYTFNILDSYGDGLSYDSFYDSDNISFYRILVNNDEKFKSDNRPDYGYATSYSPIAVKLEPVAYICLTADPNLDSDNDGIINYKDPDYAAANNSSIINDVMASIDADNDGIPNHLDLDSDNDGIPDLIESKGIDTNGDGKIDNINPDGTLKNDTNKNGLDDFYDTDNGGNSLLNLDTDGDGLPNSQDLDSDNDGIPDIIEAGGTDPNKNGKVEPTTDVDKDGFDDAVDGSIGTPLITTASDTNNDGIADSYTKGDADADKLPNFLDIDSDNDGIPDNIEAQKSKDYIAPSNPSGAMKDNNKNGVDDNYEIIGGYTGFGLIPENTDNTDEPDYLDTDSDNDGVLDIAENGHSANVLSGSDTDGDGLFDIFDDNNHAPNTRITVNDGTPSVKKITTPASLETFGDQDNDYPGAGDIDFRDIPDPANAMITQVYQNGNERWIEITNIGTTDIPANTINVKIYKNKTIKELVSLIDIGGILGGVLGFLDTPSVKINKVLEPGKSVLIKNSGNTSIPTIGNSSIIVNDVLTALDDAVNDIITLSSTTGSTSWANRYDVISNITNKTSMVRIDEVLSPNKDFTPSEWVVFIDDEISIFEAIGDIILNVTKRLPQASLISEVLNSNRESNTMLGLHRINYTSITDSGKWSNGVPDRSRHVVINEDYNHTSKKLSARKLTVDPGKKLKIKDNLLVVSNEIILEGEIRLEGTSQLIQTHTGSGLVTGAGKLLVDQDPKMKSMYRYMYMTSPVNNNSSLNKYNLETVLKDGTDKDNPKDINFISGYDGAATKPISIAEHWIYTYTPSTSHSNWAHQYKGGLINRGDAFIFKGPGEFENYTFAGTPNDGSFNANSTIGGGLDYLIGNPYPSAMNARKFLEDNSDALNGTIYLWEQHANKNGEGSGIDGHTYGGYVGGYATINKSMGLAANQNSFNNEDPKGASGLGKGQYKEPKPYIAIAQGFFVKGDIDGGTINFNNSQRAFVKESPTESVFFKESKKSNKAKNSSRENLLPIIKLGFDYKNDEDKMFHKQIGISFQETNSFDYDNGYDSEIYGVGSTDIYWKFPSSDKKYSIAGVQAITSDLEVPLEIVMGYTGEVSIYADEIQNMPNEVFITDKETGVSYEIINNKASLILEEGIYKDRFVISFKNATLSIEDNLINGFMNVYSDNDNKLLIISKKEDITVNQVQMYSILGREVSTWNITEQKQRMELAVNKKLSTGIYIIKLETNKGSYSKKVMIE